MTNETREALVLLKAQLSASEEAAFRFGVLRDALTASASGGGVAEPATAAERSLSEVRALTQRQTALLTQMQGTSLAEIVGREPNLRERIAVERVLRAVTVRQEELQAEGTTRGMVMDFGAFKQAVREEVARLDHMFLVEEGSLRRSTIEALQGEGFTLLVLPFRTTAENLARYLYQRISARHLPVSQVDVYETPLNCASYFGE